LATDPLLVVPPNHGLPGPALAEAAETLSTSADRRWIGTAARGLASAAVGIFLIVGWQFTATYLVRPIWISSPVLVYERFLVMMQDGSLLSDTWQTVEEALVGLIIGVITGSLAGVALARFQNTARVVGPYVMGAYSIPRVALAPFFMLWFGIGIWSKIVLVWSVVFFIVLFNVREGVENIDHDLIDVLKSMRAGRMAMMRHVTIPSVIPWVIASIKIGIGMALVGAVVGEMLGAASGLGWRITYSLSNFDTTGAMLCLLVMGVLAACMSTLVGFIERRAFRWRGSPAGSMVVPQ
jgi:NitT/TauT family transport system permease protein